MLNILICDVVVDVPLWSNFISLGEEEEMRDKIQVCNEPNSFIKGVV